MVDVRPSSEVAEPEDAATGPSPSRSGWDRAFRRAVPACLMLLAIYLGLSLLNDPRGYLGTDTGGKVATLQAMHEHGGLNPDIGYWAERSLADR